MSCQVADYRAVQDRIMDFGPAVFDKVGDVTGRGNSHAACWYCAPDLKDVDPAQAIAVGNDCTEDMSAHLAGIETYLVTDYVIGDATSSGADHISNALGFERWVLEDY